MILTDSQIEKIRNAWNKEYEDKRLDDALIGYISPRVRKRNYLTTSEFFIIVWWKSDDRFKDWKPKEAIERNSAEEIRRITSDAFTLLTRGNVDEAILGLNKLWGIGLSNRDAKAFAAEV